MYNVLYERDLLYPTENIAEPGCVHIEVLNPNKKAKIPIIIQSKTNHSPANYIDSIIRIMQSDIFDRIFVDIKSNGSIYIKKANKCECNCSGKAFTKVIFDGDSIVYEDIDDIEG